MTLEEIRDGLPNEFCAEGCRYLLDKDSIARGTGSISNPKWKYVEAKWVCKIDNVTQIECIRVPDEPDALEALIEALGIDP